MNFWEIIDFICCRSKKVEEKKRYLLTPQAVEREIANNPSVM